MGEQTHFENFVDHILSDDDSELGKTKAELNYALHCLEREIAIGRGKFWTCKGNLLAKIGSKTLAALPTPSHP